jgi:glucose-1-phosphate adenylyltransferase
VGEPRVLAFVLAGGEGRRLRPLTEDRAKPAVELGRGTRIVDFVLANLVNSRVRWIYLLAQYKPESLLEHLARTWQLPCLVARGDYRGTADAVRRNLDLVERHRPDVVAVFAADHVYRMDVRQMIAFHRARAAEVTVAAMPVPLAEASRFGVIRAAAGGRVENFEEKPAAPAPIPGDGAHAFASMGNYLFDPVALQGLLGGRCDDFGRQVLPEAVRGGSRVYAYDFSTNRVPGVKPWEDAAYWRDVGTVQALDAARRDIEGSRPRFDLGNPEWPLAPGGRQQLAA